MCTWNKCELSQLTASCIIYEQEAENISDRFMLHTCQIGFTVNIDKKVAGSSMATSATQMLLNQSADVSGCHSFESTKPFIALFIFTGFAVFHLASTGRFFSCRFSIIPAAVSLTRLC